MKKDRPFWVKWYKTTAWKKLRLKQLAREPLCRMCRLNGIVTPADTVDHIEPHRGKIEKFFDLQNLQSLDKKCHSGQKQKLEKSGDFGCDENGIVSAWRE